jgi:hypothetical protein
MKNANEKNVERKKFGYRNIGKLPETDKSKSKLLQAVAFGRKITSPSKKRRWKTTSGSRSTPSKSFGNDRIEFFDSQQSGSFEKLNVSGLRSPFLKIAVDDGFVLADP